MALIVIMTGLRKQAYQLEFYSEGTVPACFVSPGDANITPTQIRELQDALNGYANDQAWHHKIIVLPPGAKVDPMRSTQLADQFDEFLANEIAMVFDVDPMSLGMVPNVSTTVSPFAAKEMAQASRTVHERTSTKPLLKFLCSIANTILHSVCGQDDMKFSFAGMNEAQDQAAQTDLLVKQVQNGIRSVDEAREELALDAVGAAGNQRPGGVHADGADAVPVDARPGSDRRRRGTVLGTHPAVDRAWRLARRHPAARRPPPAVVASRWHPQPEARLAIRPSPGSAAGSVQQHSRQHPCPRRRPGARGRIQPSPRRKQ